MRAGGIGRVMHEHDVENGRGSGERIFEPLCLFGSQGDPIRLSRIAVDHVEMDWPIDKVVIPATIEKAEVIKIWTGSIAVPIVISQDGKESFRGGTGTKFPFVGVNELMEILANILIDRIR